MAADRGAYIDQSQSLNVHIAEPNYGKLTSMHFYAWKTVSLKSGSHIFFNSLFYISFCSVNVFMTPLYKFYIYTEHLLYTEHLYWNE